MRPKVYITRRIPDQITAMIENHCDVRMWHEKDTTVPREILEREITDADGLFCLLTETIDAQLMEMGPRLKVISNMAVGYNNIDIEAANNKGILVTNTPGILTETTADLTFALLMATARRITEASDYLRNGKWSTWSPMLLTGQDVHGATLGIIGMGRIGEAVAKRAKGFDMKILYHNRSRRSGVEENFGAMYVDLKSLLRESDFVCVLVPFSKETVNLIGKEELALMKRTSILINTSRGGIVNETALNDALVEGTIWAAGLDVFSQEPIALDHPLLSLPNVVVLPHIGSASVNTRLGMAQLAAHNLCKALLGEIPPNLVNK
ncbi:glyoxylate reductase [Paenibacillus sp. yr247]|uniref:2-hydroxyacid dehydrogenase n=1 Tax=Paenibacillus sp. yr247 TaxID=1761880 RepID=UPI00087E149A|nr:D-glycerate dehydrogenase [Paenibacillus sp. yr247]SDO24740.1 glyoxylate reductase [Paenibacillus sp. yr247]